MAPRRAAAPVQAAPSRASPAGAAPAGAPPAARGGFSDSDADNDTAGLFNIEIGEADELVLRAKMSTTFIVPWSTAGERCGPQQAWQCLQCAASVGSQTFDITAYKTAVKTAAGDEYFVFAIVVVQTEQGSADNGTASEALTSLRGFKATALSQRSRRPGGASQGLGADLNIDLDAQDMLIAHASISSIRELSPEEEVLLREHTATGKGGKVGHYLVPKGVERIKEHFNRFNDNQFNDNILFMCDPLTTRTYVYTGTYVCVRKITRLRTDPGR